MLRIQPLRGACGRPTRNLRCQPHINELNGRLFVQQKIIVSFSGAILHFCVFCKGHLRIAFANITLLAEPPRASDGIPGGGGIGGARRQGANFVPTTMEFALQCWNLCAQMSDFHCKRRPTRWRYSWKRESSVQRR